MIIDRETALQNLAVGDIFHAQSPNGASLVCLVTSVDGDTICARRIHTQDDLQFDRKTGLELDEPHSRIDCAVRLPHAVYNVLVAMNRRYQAAHALISQGIEVDPKEARYTEDERHAHDVLHDHIAANPI